MTAGVWALGNENNHYTNNTIHDVDEYAIRAGHSTDMPGYTRHASQREDAPVIAGNVIYDTGGDAIIGHYPYALIAGNDIDLADSNGDPAGHTGIGISSTGENPSNNEDDVVSHHVVVLDNIINGAGWHGIQSDVALDAYTENCTIIGNEITNCAGNGVYLLAVQGWTVTNNILTATRQAGIAVWSGGKDTSISYNLVTACGASDSSGGIYVSINDFHISGLSDDNRNVENLLIIGNTCLDNSGSGIWLRNWITDDGITWFRGSDFTISGNECSGNSAYGFRFNNGGSALILNTSFVASNNEFEENGPGDTNY